MFTELPRPHLATPTVVREGPGGHAGRLLDAVDAHLATSLDELDEIAIQSEMAVNEQLVRRLNARNAEAAETLVRR